MGYTWEVLEWLKGEPGFEYRSVYQGESLLTAIHTMWRVKRKGAGCVKLVWR